MAKKRRTVRRDPSGIPPLRRRAAPQVRSPAAVRREVSRLQREQLRSELSSASREASLLKRYGGITASTPTPKPAELPSGKRIKRRGRQVFQRVEKPSKVLLGAPGMIIVKAVCSSRDGRRFYRRAFLGEKNVSSVRANFNEGFRGCLQSIVIKLLLSINKIEVNDPRSTGSPSFDDLLRIHNVRVQVIDWTVVYGQGVRTETPSVFNRGGSKLAVLQRREDGRIMGTYEVGFASRKRVDRIVSEFS